jgi:hypothetical protein
MVEGSFWKLASTVKEAGVDTFVDGALDAIRFGVPDSNEGVST